MVLFQLSVLLMLASTHSHPHKRQADDMDHGDMNMAGEEECCDQKMVGEDRYFNIGYDHNGMTFDLNCLSPCIFEKEDQPGSKYCFAAGDMKVECEDDMDYTPTNRPRPTGEMTEGPDGETDDGMTEDPNGVTGGNGAPEVRQNILDDLYKVWRAFRDPLNGAWCDNLYFPDVEEFEELTPCGEDNNFYSSAGMGMGLVSEAAAVELGIQTREDGEARVRQSLETVLSSWPRETTHGFLQHFTTRQMNVISEYSTIDSTILTLGALFAGNYFGGEVAALAEDLLGSVQWSDAIEAADSPRIFPVVNKDSGAMEGYIAPYNEYYMVAYLANMTSSPGSKAAQHFATFMGNDGAPPGANGHPVPITYEGFTLLTDNYNNYFMSSFIPQFNYYLTRGCQTNPFQLQLISDWMQADKLFWSTALPSDATIWGSQVAGKVWGAGAGPAPSGYGVERINGSADLVISAAIMAGFLPAAPTEAIREEINQQLDWLYTNNVCAYPVIQGGVTRKILWRCSVRLPDWRSPNVDSIDFSTFVHGYSTNFLPADFYKTYSA